MDEHSESIIVEHAQQHLSVSKYMLGFAVSMALTLTAYFLTTHGLSKNILIGLLSGLAIVQFGVQMVLFLHVGGERKPRWKLMVMCLMLMVVLILVFGSLWIMNNLNYRMSPQQVEQYLKSQDSL